MLKFVGGLLFGMLMSVSYVRWNYSLPEFLQLPELVKNAAVVIASDDVLYDLDKPIATRRRALEAFFQHQPKMAVKIDARFGHAFLNNLYRRKVIRNARQLRAMWNAFDKALARAPLRKALEKKHGTTDPLALKQAMLMEAFLKRDFLVQWIRHNEAPVTRQTLLPMLIRLGRMPR